MQNGIRCVYRCTVFQEQLDDAWDSEAANMIQMINQKTKKFILINFADFESFLLMNRILSVSSNTKH